MKEKIKKILIEDPELRDTILIFITFIFMVISMFAYAILNPPEENTNKLKIGFDFNGDTLFEVEENGTVTKYYEYNE